MVEPDALQLATASSREEKPRAMMEGVAMSVSSDASFGYAITRCSAPVSLRSPAITA